MTGKKVSFLMAEQNPGQAHNEYNFCLFHWDYSPFTKNNIFIISAARYSAKDKNSSTPAPKCLLNNTGLFFWPQS